MMTKNNPKPTKSHKPTAPATTSTASIAAVDSTAGQAPAPQASQAPTTAPATLVTTPGTSVARGNRKGNKAALQTSIAALIAGLQASFAPDYVFDFPEGSVTTSELIATFAQFIQAAEATKAQYLSWRNAVASERTVQAQVMPTRARVKSALKTKYGETSPQMSQFGFAPYKVPAKSAAAKTVGAAKANATKAARGTSKKPKLTVTATSTGVTITSGDAPTTASAPAAATKPTAS
jgi:hypothetical protein